MKLAILGDTHFGMRNDNQIFANLYSRFYNETFFPYLKENDVNCVVQLGDLFDRRKYINFQTLAIARDSFFDFFKRNPMIEFHTLLGNHDIFYKNKLDVNSPVLLLNDLDIHIHTQPKTMDFGGVKFDFIPWMCDDNYDQVVKFIRESNSEFCFGHFELEGFEMDAGNFCQEGMDSDVLKRYELVMTGHFHHRSQKGNILYVGSPGEMTWADYNDPRGFHIFDTDTREIEFIENPFTIFRKYNYNDEDLYLDDVNNLDYTQFQNKYVKIVVSKKTNSFLFDTLVDNVIKSAPADLTIVEDFSEITVDELHEVDQADDTATILDKYIDNVEIDLNKTKLKSIIKEVYTEALTIE